MTQEQQHPITPPPELVASLRNSAPHGIRDAGVTREHWLINRAYAAGADQHGAVNEAELQKARDEELEACKQVIIHQGWFASGHRVAELTAARRPQPSDKELALRIMAKYAGDWDGLRELDSDDIAILTRALEALPNG